MAPLNMHSNERERERDWSCPLLSLRVSVFYKMASQSKPSNSFPIGSLSLFDVHALALFPIDSHSNLFSIRSGDSFTQGVPPFQIHSGIIIIIIINWRSKKRVKHLKCFNAATKLNFLLLPLSSLLLPLCLKKVERAIQIEEWENDNSFSSPSEWPLPITWNQKTTTRILWGWWIVLISNPQVFAIIVFSLRQPFFAN